MATIAPQGRFRAFDENGDPLAGGKLYTFEAGTTTPKVTYTTQDEAAANTNPVILDSEGYADVWLEAGAYKFQLDDSADVTLWTVDDIAGDSAQVFGATVNSVSGNTNVSTDNRNNLYLCTGTITLSLPDAALAGEGFQVIVKNVGSGTVTLDPNGSETINGSATLDLSPNSNVIVNTNGTAWQTFADTVRATQTQAEAGTDSYALMTPERSLQALRANSGKPAFRAYPSGVQSITQSSETVLQYDTETFDTDGAYNTTNYRFTPLVAGKYFVGVQVQLATLTDGTRVTLRIRKNAAGVALNAVTAGAATSVGNNVQDVVELNGSTDYIDFTVEHDDSTARNNSGVGAGAFAFAYRVAD